MKAFSFLLRLGITNENNFQSQLFMEGLSKCGCIFFEIRGGEGFISNIFYCYMNKCGINLKLKN